MNDTLKSLLTRRNIIAAVVLLLVVVAVPLSVYLVQQQQRLRSRAAGETITFAGAGVTCDASGCRTTLPNIDISFHSPFGPYGEPGAVVTPTPTTNPTGAVTPTSTVAPTVQPPAAQVGPCTGQLLCKWDTRDMIYSPDGSKITESVTAYGKFYNWDAPVNTNNWTAWPSNGSDLTSVPRYAQGPCAGKAAGTCQWDTRDMIYSPDGSRITESVTAYGKFFNWEAPVNTNNWTIPSWQPPAGGDLTSVPRYAQGPCAGRAAGTCKWDTRDMIYSPDGTKVTESVTAYGKFYNWDAPVNTNNWTAWPSNGSDLTSVPRYAQGPCAGRAAGACQWDTRDMIYSPDGSKITESVTAYGKFYNWDAPVNTNNWTAWPSNGSDLTSVARYGR